MSSIQSTPKPSVRVPFTKPYKVLPAIGPNRYLLHKCKGILQIDVFGTAVQEQHIARLCKAGMSLILFEFTSALQQFLDGPPSQNVLRVLETYPRVVLVDGRAGFVFVITSV